MAKKITLKNKAGEVLCPHTAIEQVQGLKEALDDKLGKTEKAASAGSLTPLTLDHADTTSNAGLTVYQLWPGNEGTDILPNGSMMLNMATNDGVKKQLLFGHPVGSNDNMVIQYRRRAGSWSDWKTVAFTDSNVASATKADTATDSSKLGGISASNYMKGDGRQKHINFNEQLNVGIFRNTGVSTDPVEGAPTEGGGYGNLMVIRSGRVDTLAQMYFNYHNNSVFVRAGNTDPSTTVFIGSRAWSKVRYMDDLVTTSHIADTAITSAKLASSLILKGTPQLATQPTLSSESQNIASVGLVKEAVDGIEIGGTNLILNSDFSQGTKHWEDWNKTASFSVEKGVATFTLNPSYPDILKTSVFEITNGQQYIVSLDVRSDDSTILDYCYLMGVGVSNIYLGGIGGITSEWKRRTYSFTATTTGSYCFGFGKNSGGSFQFRKVKIEKGNKATDWSPAPEDITLEISNAETRSKAHAEDYTNAEIDKIENGDIVAQKANSLYDADSNKYKNWGEIDTAITRKIGDKFEDYATKSYVQGEISKQVAVPIASETEDGKVKLATPEDVTAVENDNSAVNDSAKAVTPYTLKEYIASKNFATSSDISSAVTAAKTTIFFQVAQPAGGKDGDIWIIP